MVYDSMLYDLYLNCIIILLHIVKNNLFRFYCKYETQIKTQY
jgi:hypothetical protein